MLSETSIITTIPELSGARIRHTSSDYGTGRIDRVWLDNDGSDHVSIVFDNGRQANSFGLSRCMDRGLLCFDESGMTEKVLQFLDRARTERSRTFPMPDPPVNDEAESCSLPSPDLTEFFEDLDLLLEEEPMPELTEEQERAEKQAIYHYLVDERHVRAFVHFTPEANLPSILEHGILPRSELETQRIAAIMPDQDRLDFQPEYSSFSISHPNYLVFYSKRINMENTPFVVLSVDPRIIMDLPLRSISYLPDNAASWGIRDVRRYTTLEAAKELFGEQATVRRITRQRSELNIPENYPTNPQAEVFIRGAIPPEYISEIHVEDSKQNESVRTAIGPEMIRKYKIISQSRLYLQRKDFRLWSAEKEGNGTQNG